MPARGALALATDLVWASELHFREVSDELTRQPPPCATRRRRIHDDGNAGFGEELGRVRERPVNDLPRRIRLGAVVEEGLANLGELEYAHRRGSRCQGLRGAPGERCLAAARKSGDPDGPARPGFAVAA